MTEPNSDGEIYKNLQTPEARHLAELYLLKADLNAAHDTLKLYFQKYAGTNVQVGQKAIVGPSLFRDGVLLFCSCFSTSEKETVKLDPRVVYRDVPGWEDFYKTLTDMRHAFVAHNFGPQRQHDIIVICAEEEGQLVPAAFTQLYIRFGGWTVEERDHLLSFIDVARDFLANQIVDEEAVVMDIVAALTPDQLTNLPDAELAIPSRADFRTTRERFRKTGAGSRRPVPQRRLGRITVLD